MVLNCVAVWCTNYRGKKDGLSFHRFPADVERREKWIAALRRAGGEKANKEWRRTSRICNEHFVGGKPSEDPAHPDFVPTIFAKSKPSRLRGVGSGKVEKIKCLKRKNDMEAVAQRKLQSMISGQKFDLEDLQVQHVQLLKAFNELQKEAEKLHAENEKLEDALQSDFSKLSYRFLQCDNKQLLFLTGLQTDVFDWLVPKIAPCIFRVHPEVNPQDHLLIILMKLKLGLCDNDLGYRFQISGGIVTAICQTWIPVLAEVLGPLIAWPSTETIVKTTPRVFKGRVSCCRCIVDTFEVTFATPSATTKVVRYLIGITPAGAISFVSPGFFSSKKSEKQIITESGFMDVLKPMDLLLTNKKFSIRKELNAVGVTLLTPDGAGRKGVPVAVWSHVEKVIDWWKDFCIFQTTITADYMDLLDDIVLICAALTNVKMSAFPKVNTET